MLTAFVILLLIVTNALYVAAEFAAVAVPRSRIRGLAAQGSRLAALLLPVVDDARQLDRYIACSQVGITASSLVLGAFGQATLTFDLAPVFREAGLDPVAALSAASATVLISLTMLQMIVGELVPKTLALQNPTRVALFTVMPMRWSLRALSWFITVLNGSGTALLRLFGASGGGHRHVHSPVEIDMLISESRAGGALGPEVSRRLRRALHLGSRVVRQIMIPRTRIDALEADITVGEAATRAAASPHTRLPLYEDSIDNVLGYVHSRDLMVARFRVGPDSPVRPLMRPVIAVPETLSVDRLLTRLHEEHAQLAIVMDEFGGLAGLVTFSDAVAEILGTLPDEFAAARGIEGRSEGRIKVPGSLRIGEFDAWLAAAWPGRAQTVGGRLVETLGRVPARGETLTVRGVEVEIEDATLRVVKSLVITPPRERDG